MIAIFICAACTVWWYPFPLLVGTLQKDICAQSPAVSKTLNWMESFFSPLTDTVSLTPSCLVTLCLGEWLLIIIKKVEFPFTFIANVR